MMPGNEFISWREQNTPYLVKVKSLLATELPDYEELIINNLRMIECHYARVGTLLADANGHLDRETAKFFEDIELREKFKTVREMEIASESKMSPVREIRDKIEAILRAIELRVTLGQSILRQQRGERKMSETNK